MSSDPQDELENLARRLGEHGYQFRKAQYFGATGVLVHSRAVDCDGIAVIESSVFLYARGPRWEARLTEHGGPHWIREVDSIDRLEKVALDALRSLVRPPTAEWKVVEA